MSKHEFNVFGLPTHELPLFTEKTGRDWVDYGFDNQYGDYLRDLYLGSSIQAAVVNGVSEMIYGDGLDATDREEQPEQWLKTQKLLENSDEDIMRQLCFRFEALRAMLRAGHLEPRKDRGSRAPVSFQRIRYGQESPTVRGVSIAITSVRTGPGCGSLGLRRSNTPRWI